MKPRQHNEIILIENYNSWNSLGRSSSTALILFAAAATASSSSSKDEYIFVLLFVFSDFLCTFITTINDRYT